MMKVTAHGQLTEDDYLHAQRLHFQSTNWTRFLTPATIIVWAIGVIFMLAYALLTSSIPYGTMMSISLAFVVFVVPVTKRVILPRQANRLFQQNKELSAPMDLEFDEVGMRLANSFGETRRTWTDFCKWKEDEQCCLLYQSEAAFHAIPTRFFNEPEGADFIREQLQSNDVPVAGALKQMTWIQAVTFALVTFTVASFIFITLSQQLAGTARIPHDSKRNLYRALRARQAARARTLGHASTKLTAISREIVVWAIYDGCGQQTTSLYTLGRFAQLLARLTVLAIRHPTHETRKEPVDAPDVRCFARQDGILLLQDACHENLGYFISSEQFGALGKHGACRWL